ncbi:MAG: hypothetical protein KBG46_12035 [Paracoccus sp.]|nr:hypothetical protein [Paracoccus sp. (in: a-proteobacteria)]
MKPLSSSYVKPSATVFDSAINNWGRVPVGKPRAYPRADDPRVVDGMIFPNLLPRFTLKPGEAVFTIGSCFAREIERHLDDRPADNAHRAGARAGSGRAEQHSQRI